MKNLTEPIAVPLLDLRAQYATIRTELRAAVDRVLESQHFILGPEVEALEGEIAAYSQCEHGVGVSSGTDALLVALMALGIEPGDEVITTPYTFFATAGSIARLGARPVFVDIEPHSFNIDATKIGSAITGRTRGIIVVHLFGQMADMDPITKITQRHNLFVIEDAAQAIGAEYKGRRAGSIGHIGCFSFFPSKNLGGLGDGGMVTTNDSALADRIKLLRNHGHRPKYYNKVVGGNFRLDAIQAAALRVKLNYLDRWTEARQRNAANYRRLFAETDLTIGVEQEARLETVMGVVLPEESAQVRHIYNQFVIRTGWRHRDLMMAYLKQNRIDTEIYYPVPIHLQECFASHEYQPGDLPVSERVAQQSLAVPIYPELSSEMQKAVVSTIAAFHTPGN